MELENQKAFIIQCKVKRKNSEWIDYMIFNDVVRAMESVNIYRNPHHLLFIDNRHIRLIHREIQETLVS